jgi:hypothetical protein
MRQLTHMAHVLFARNRCQYPVPGHVTVMVTATALYTVSATYSHGCIAATARRRFVTPAVYEG